ncbi:uncharacterized protein LOC106167468 [Lingula anatina]|uniref:Uncharacterized protein LOC106167468 n=1 Tax=Lingula anatina TaxID=7574 RepID=A0A1S3IUF7_LINAN|nr:uncharacterized protein LOC106167468 [Lingula anatina]|eukprot:XP_013401708.1 uncharacterized protein LOC106167468 [Lingula anatina]
MYRNADVCFRRHPLRARLLGDLFTTVENPLYKAGLEDNPNPTIDKLKSYKGRRPFARDYDHSNMYQDHRIDTVSESCTDPSPVTTSNEIDSIYDTIEGCSQDTMSPVFSETTCTGQNQPTDSQRHLLGSVETPGGGGDVH